MQQDQEPSAHQPPADGGTTPGHRSGKGAGSLWEQIHRDEQRRENSDPQAHDASTLPVPPAS